MSIPNVSTLYQKIASGAEGGLEFARFIKLLLIADCSSKAVSLISESDASGDYKGLDAYIEGDDDFPQFITGFQFKFYPTKLSPNQKAEIIKSLERALYANEFIQEYILITPEDFMKEQQGWFDSLKQKYEKSYFAESNGLYRKCGFKLIHWGHSKIIELSIKHEQIGSKYYPELFPFPLGAFKLSTAKIDCKNSLWEERSHYSYSQLDSIDSDLTSDPLLDFQFVNNTASVFLLDRIEIQVESISTSLRGLPSNYFLKSIGTFECRIDFKKKINTIEFDDPLIVPAHKPLRFKVQLTQFTKDCPGNSCSFKFWFHFQNHSILTESFRLSF